MSDLAERPDVDDPPVVVRQPAKADLEPARYRRRQRTFETSLAVATPVVLLGLWEIAGRSGWIDTRFFPAPSHIWTVGIDLIRSGDLQEALVISGRRVAIGYFVGCSLGILAGIAMSMSRLVRAAFEPLVYAAWTVPKLALLPLLLLIFGLGEMPILVLISITCFFLVFIPTLATFRAVPFPYREAAMSFDATRWQMLRHVTFPFALPAIFVAMRLTAGASLLTLVAAEFVQSNEGIGFLIWNSWSLFLADRMYVGIVVVAFIGALFTLVVAAVGRRLAPWATES